MSKLISLGDIAYLLYPIIPLKWMYAFARMQGRFIYLVRRKERSAVRNNLSVAFGKTKSQSEIDLMTRQFFEYNQLRDLLWLLAPQLGSSKMSELFPMEGIEHLDWALSQERGVILLGCHLNSICMFIAIMMLRSRGYDVRVAMPEPGDPWAPTLLRRVVNRFLGRKTLTLNELVGAFYCQFNIRPIVQCLADNVIVAQTGDGWHSIRFVEVEFLGRLLPFTIGVTSIAQMTGSVIVPMFEVGTPPDELRVIIEEPFTVEKGEQPDRNLQMAVAAYVKRLEHRLLESIPCWQHWLIDNTLDTMATWPQRSLDEKYRI